MKTLSTLFLSLFFSVQLAAQWTYTSLTHGRFQISAAFAADKVVFTGGGTIGFMPSNVVDVFDVHTGERTNLNMIYARHAPTSIGVGDNVYIAGGYHLGTGEDFNAVEVLNVQTLE